MLAGNRRCRLEVRLLPTVRVRFALLMIGLLLNGCQDVPTLDHAPTLDHDGYIWHRTWSAGGASDAAALQAGPLSRLRVLVAEARSPQEELRGVAGAAKAMDKAPLPVIAVVRIGGAAGIEAVSPSTVVDPVLAWREAGVEVVGLEIDHDCGSRSLAGYARWLNQLTAEAATVGVERVSITALPTWTSTEAVADVIAAVDEVVVQVHAVRAPSIFDVDEAERWLRAWSAVSARPFRAALPTYRVQVGGEDRRAEPTSVAELLGRLDERPVAGLVGVTWFRLPIGGDDRAWNLTTLHAVIARRPLRAAPSVWLVEAAPGLYDVIVANGGNVSASAPAVIVDGAVEAAGAVGLYGGSLSAERRAGRRWRAVPHPDTTLRPGAERVIGWIRGESLVASLPTD